MFLFPQTVYCWGSILERKELATLTGRAPDLCGWALWLGSVAGPCPPLILLLAAPLNSVNSVAGLCGWPCPPLVLLLAAPLNSVNSVAVAGPCPPLVLLLAAPLNSVNSVAELCGWALSSSCPPLGRAPKLCQLCGWTLWLGLVLLLSSSWPRPSTLSTLWLGSVAGPLVLLLAAPLNSVNSVAGLCGWALSSSWPRP